MRNREEPSFWAVGILLGYLNPCVMADNSDTNWKNRIFSEENKKVTRRFFSAYAQTWIGLNPLWLMGEALTPGTKVGSKFKQGSTQLREAAIQVANALSTSSQDIIVIIDQKLGEGKSDTIKTAEVIRAAGYALLPVFLTLFDP